jgi:hypothetical protein
MNPAAALLLALAVDAAVAQPAVTPGPSQPVKVTNDASSPVPVTVQGAPLPVSIQGTANVSGSVNLTNAFVPVTVIDDLLNQPRIETAFGAAFVEQGDIATDGLVTVTAKFNVPDGKRFIVETVTIDGAIPLETPPLPVKLTYFIGTAIGSIPFQRTSGDPTLLTRFGEGEVLSAVLPMKLRVDARIGADDELKFALRTRFPVGQTFAGSKLVIFQASAFGYLVDLP